MGFAIEDALVRGDLFKESGKWAYTVVLDYRGPEGDEKDDPFYNWDLHAEARRALARATENGISGVSLKEIPEGWTLVVLEPYAELSHPITVKR